MMTLRKRTAALIAALALGAGGLSVAVAPAAPAEAAQGYTYLYPTDFTTFNACNTKRLTMNSSWTRSSQCFTFRDTDRYGNKIGPLYWKFSVSVRGY